MKDVHFKGCELKFANFGSCKFNKVDFDTCNLIAAEFAGTKLNGLDFTTCRIDALKVKLLELKGIKVTPDQALEFAKMLGIKIEGMEKSNE